MAIELFGRMGSMIDGMLNWFVNLPWWAQIIFFVGIFLLAFWIYRMKASGY